MEAKRLNGIELSYEIKHEMRKRVKKLNDAGIYPALGTILIGNDIGSVKYVAGKHEDCQDVGIKSIKIHLPENTSERRVLNAAKKLNEDKECSGFIVQLPLPEHIDTKKVIDSIDPYKDVDGLCSYNLGSLVLGIDQNILTPIPCTPMGILSLIDHYLGESYFGGKHVVVIGRGITVGRTIGLLLTRRDINATVTLCHTKTKDLTHICKQADVIISATGSPNIVNAHMVKSGAVLIDVGVSRDQFGNICGDIDKKAYRHASWYSPNPGGVGPMTRVMLLENVLRKCEYEYSQRNS